MKAKICIYSLSQGNDGIFSSKAEKVFNRCSYIAIWYCTSDGNTGDDIFSHSVSNSEGCSTVKLSGLNYLKSF